MCLTPVGQYERGGLTPVGQYGVSNTSRTIWRGGVCLTPVGQYGEVVGQYGEVLGCV